MSSGSEPFSMGVPKNPMPASQAMIQNTRLTFNADGKAVYNPIAGSSPAVAYQSTTAAVVGENFGGSHDININLSEPPMKRKRGRPRKYELDGSMAPLPAMSPAPVAAVPVTQSVATPSSLSGGGGSAMPALKKGRGRPPGSSNKARGRPPGSTKKQQIDALGSAGAGFIPHVISVKAGEDVSSKIMSFSQHGPRAVCVLSASGVISNVSLRQTATSGGTATYEGRFDILSLSGSFLLSEVDGQRSRTGGLSVSLTGPDGRVLGGCVAGLLTAASPVQVIVGSFIAEGGRKEAKGVNQTNPVTAGGSSPGSHGGTFSGSSSVGEPGSPLNLSTGGCNNNTTASQAQAQGQGLSHHMPPWK